MSEQNNAEVVYFAQCEGGIGPIKIGYSRNPVERLACLSSLAPFPLVILASIAGGSALEARFHTAFWPHRSHGEWFLPHATILEAIEGIVSGTFLEDNLPPRLGPRPNHYNVLSPDEKEVYRMRAKLKRRLKKYEVLSEPVGMSAQIDGFLLAPESERNLCRERLSKFFAATCEPRQIDGYLEKIANQEMEAR